MTVLEWLKAGTRYSFEEKTFIRIALDRGCNPEDDVYDESVVTQRQKDLMDADIIYIAVLHSPSNTSSISQSHNGYQKSIGQEQDFYQDEKIKYAIRIYKKYGDDKGLELEDVANDRKIKFVPIVDVERL